MTLRLATILLVMLTLTILPACEPETPADGAELTGPGQELASYTDQLRSQYVSYEPVDRRRSSDCRRIVNSMVFSADNAQGLSDTIASLLKESETFRMYDYDLLSIGSEALADCPPKDNRYLLVLAKKVNNALVDPATPDAYRTKYASLTVGVLLNTIHYPARVETFNDEVNLRQWDAFRTWLDENFDALFYDDATNVYRLTPSRLED
jgi:hypothetical protein